MKMGPIIGAILLCLLAGCATLRVDVDILDPVGVEETVSDAQLLRLYHRVQREDPDAVRVKVEELKERVDRAANELAKVYDDLAKTVTDEPQKKLLTDSANDLRVSTKPGGSLYPAFKSLENNLVKANNAIIYAALTSGPPPPGQAIPPLLRAKLEQRRFEDIHGRAEIEANLMAMKSGAGTLPDKGRQKQIDQATASAQAALRSPIGEGALGKSEYAFAVASAPPERWVLRFNEAYGAGLFGNSDIAVKLGAQADFTVKGMKFDASTVAAMASKVTTQALLLATQIAGVSVSGAAMKDAKNKEGVVATGGAVGEIDKALLTRQATIDAWKQAIRDLAQTILSEEAYVKSDTAATRATANKSIQGVYDVNKETLSLGSLN